MIGLTGSRRGFALLTCILFSLFLVSLFYKFLGEVSLQVRIDALQNHDLQARLSARAGLALAMGLLYKDLNQTDDYTEPWAAVTRQTIEEPIIIGGGTCTVTISDESGKLNVNSASEDELVQLFHRFDLGLAAQASILGDEITIGGSQRLAQHVLDYIDADGSPRPMGAEAEEYAKVTHLRPRNGPLVDVAELQNIPGVGDHLYLASGTRPGLKDLLTVQGKGFINLNTAPRELFEAIDGPPGYDGTRRRLFFDELENRIPFQKVAGYSEFVRRFDPFIPRAYTDRFVVFTENFRIEAVGISGGVERKVIAWVFRERAGRCHVTRMVEIP